MLLQCTHAGVKAKPALALVVCWKCRRASTSSRQPNSRLASSRAAVSPLQPGAHTLFAFYRWLPTHHQQWQRQCWKDKLCTKASTHSARWAPLPPGAANAGTAPAESVPPSRRRLALAATGSCQTAGATSSSSSATWLSAARGLKLTCSLEASRPTLAIG